MNTPCGPICQWIASSHATGIWNTQKQNRLIHVGVQVSPAPLNDCVNTRPYAKNTKPALTIRKHATAYGVTAGPGAKLETIHGANTMKMTLTAPSTIALYLPAVHTDSSARSGSFAPSAWPTIVAAALLRPHAGRIAKITSLMPIV